MGACLSAPSPDGNNELLNEAIILIKPHCSSSNAFVEYVLDTLKSNKLSVVKSGVWTGTELKDQGVVDRHYGALAQRALHDSPKSLEIDEETKTKFATAFGVTWLDAIAADTLLNLTESFKRLPHMNESTIASAWRAGGSVKLMPGTYVAKVEDLFIVNGFYADMVSSWKQPDSRVLFYLVQWKEADLTWADFRGKLIGSTDPAKADGGSIRGTLLRDFTIKFGLDISPTTTLNGVHASAGPIEGARECTIWSKMDLTHTFLLEKAAKLSKVSPEAWKLAMDNSRVSLKSGQKGLIFDVTEGMSAVQALDVLKEMSSL